MSPAVAAGLQIALVVLALAAVHVPLGEYMARIFTSPKHWRVESGLYRTLRIDAGADQRWFTYLLSVLAFGVLSILVLWGLLTAQAHLPYDLGRPGMPAAQGFNTAVSFATNTNWQSYAGETALGYTAQALGLTVQNFLSAGVGMAVVAALIRGLVRRGTDRLGNFWVDLTRISLRLLLPVSIVIAVVMVASGVIQNLDAPVTVQTLAGGTQTIPGGLVASQEVIKQLGTNGGGYFNANSAHPFENPLCGDQSAAGRADVGHPVLAAADVRSNGRQRQARGGHPGDHGCAVDRLAGHGDRTRGVPSRGRPAGRGCGAGGQGAPLRHSDVHAVRGVDHADLHRCGGFDPFLVHRAGRRRAAVEPAAGRDHARWNGFGALRNARAGVVAVFVAGLMVGRTPTYLGKRIGGEQMKYVALYILVTPALVLLGSGLTMVLPSARSAVLNGGAHSLTEIVYAFGSAANNNGSAFAGLSASSNFYNIALGVVMLLGRFVPIALILALAGSLGRQGFGPMTPGPCPPIGSSSSRSCSGSSCWSPR